MENSIEHNAVHGFKVFNSDWTCRGFQFEIGKTFTEDVAPVCDGRGFHFCTKAADCFKYYAFSPDNKVAEVEALGDIDTNNDDSKCSTNKIHIIREITWHEVLDLVNLGKACTGICNSGDCNTGNRNTGNRNSGNCNSGNRNSDDYNSGNWNSGYCNSGNCNGGNYNSGNCNSGNRNSGDCNTGNANSGECNSGNRNSGDFNTSDYNTGNANSGEYNSGDCNTGNRNSGDFNTGNYNSGDWNTGDWNKSSRNTGCFNTKENRIYLFNKVSEWTYQDWLNSDARFILMRCPSNFLIWMNAESMTHEQKECHPEYSVTRGFLNHVEIEAERQIWWNSLPLSAKNIIKSIPNFDDKIFFQCTGIRVD